MILGTSLCCISILLCNMQSVTICFLIILSCTYFQFFFRCTCFHLLFFITLLYHVFSLYGKHLFYALNMRGINYVFTNQKARVNYLSSYMKKPCILYFGIIYLSGNLLPMPVMCLCFYCQHPVYTQLL